MGDLNILPTHVLLEALHEFSRTSDILSVASTCKTIQQLLEKPENSNRLWHRVCDRRVRRLCRLRQDLDIRLEICETQRNLLSFKECALLLCRQSGASTGLCCSGDIKGNDLQGVIAGRSTKFDAIHDDSIKQYPDVIHYDGPISSDRTLLGNAPLIGSVSPSIASTRFLIDEDSTTDTPSMTCGNASLYGPTIHILRVENTTDCVVFELKYDFGGYFEIEIGENDASFTTVPMELPYEKPFVNVEDMPQADECKHELVNIITGLSFACDEAEDVHECTHLTDEDINLLESTFSKLQVIMDTTYSCAIVSLSRFQARVHVLEVLGNVEYMLYDSDGLYSDTILEVIKHRVNQWETFVQFGFYETIRDTCRSDDQDVDARRKEIHDDIANMENHHEQFQVATLWFLKLAVENIRKGRELRDENGEFKSRVHNLSLEGFTQFAKRSLEPVAKELVKYGNFSPNGEITSIQQSCKHYVELTYFLSRLQQFNMPFVFGNPLDEDSANHICEMELASDHAKVETTNAGTKPIDGKSSHGETFTKDHGTAAANAIENVSKPKQDTASADDEGVSNMNDSGSQCDTSAQDTTGMQAHMDSVRKQKVTGSRIDQTGTRLSEDDSEEDETSNDETTSSEDDSDESSSEDDSDESSSEDDSDECECESNCENCSCGNDSDDSSYEDDNQDFEYGSLEDYSDNDFEFDFDQDYYDEDYYDDDDDDDDDDYGFNEDENILLDFIHNQIHHPIVNHEGDRDPCIAIGVVPNTLRTIKVQPGWKKCSIGYHGDDGCVYIAQADQQHQHVERPSFSAGRTVGFGIHINDANSMTVYYTLDGMLVAPGSKVICTSGTDLRYSYRNIFPALGIDSNFPIRVNFGLTSPFKYKMEHGMHQDAFKQLELCMNREKISVIGALRKMEVAWKEWLTVLLPTNCETPYPVAETKKMPLF